MTTYIIACWHDCELKWQQNRCFLILRGSEVKNFGNVRCVIHLWLIWCKIIEIIGICKSCCKNVRCHVLRRTRTCIEKVRNSEVKIRSVGGPCNRERERERERERLFRAGLTIVWAVCIQWAARESHGIGLRRRRRRHRLVNELRMWFYDEIRAALMRVIDPSIAAVVEYCIAFCHALSVTR